MDDKINLNAPSGDAVPAGDLGIKIETPEAKIALNDSPAPTTPAETKPEETALKTLSIQLEKPVKKDKPSIGSIFSFGKKDDKTPASAVNPAEVSGKAVPKEDENGEPMTFFNKEKEEDKDTKMMKSILSKGTPQRMKSILGSAPTLQKSIAAEKEGSQKKQLRIAQSVFVLVFLLAVGMSFYFYSEISPTFDLFGANSTAKLTDINKNLRSSQTAINKYRYLAAQLDLNNFSFVSDEFMDKTSQLTLKQLSASEAAAISTEVTMAAEDLPRFLTAVKDNLTPPIVIETYKTEAEEEMTSEQIQKQAETDLRNLLLEDRKKITQNSTLSAENEQDLRLLDNTLKLIGNNKLIGSIKGTPVQEFQSDLLAYADTLEIAQREDLQSTQGAILASTQSDIATIGSIKSQRISWLWIIEKIEEVTSEVDPNFNSGLFEVTGFEITYNGYELDASSNKIVLSGQTKTIDAKNFSDISDMIDAFEASPYFEEVEMRSFAKSGDVEKGFTASFKLDLKIEKEGMSPKNKPISLETRPVAVNTTGIKRIK